jgi:hypothetical protein
MGRRAFVTRGMALLEAFTGEGFSVRVRRHAYETLKKFNRKSGTG